MASDSSCNRREVLGALVGASLAAALPAGAAASDHSGDMIYRTFGRTGIKVSAIGLGGSHVGVAPGRERRHPHRANSHRPRDHVYG